VYTAGRLIRYVELNSDRGSLTTYENIEKKPEDCQKKKSGDHEMRNTTAAEEA